MANHKAYKILLVLLISFAVTFIFIYPVIMNIDTHIAGFYSTDEPYGVIWSFWWLKFAYLNKIQADSINMLAYPYGIKTIMLPFFPLWGLIAKYVTIFFNEIIAYNAILLSTFVLSSLTMYFLMFYLTKNMGISIFASLIYSFCPFHFVRVWQHFGTAQIQWIPLYILFLFKVWEERKLNPALFLGLALALNYYFDVHYAYYMAIVTSLFFMLSWLSDVSRKDKFQFTKLLFFAVVFGILLILPALFPFWVKFTKTSHQMTSAHSLIRPFEDLFAQSAKPLSYFLPFTEHPFFGRITQVFVGSRLWGESLTEHNIFLGFIPMFLTITAFIKRKTIISLMKTKGINIAYTLKFFLLLIVIAWLFSQPPWWEILGFKIYMPSFFIYKLLPMFRANVRFAIVVILGVSVLAAFGLLYILNKFKSKRIRMVILCLICGLSLYEFWFNPKEHTIDLSQYPYVYDWLKQQRGDFVIAEYPLETEGPNEIYKFYQTKHQKKIINGTLPGTYANRIIKTISKLSMPKTASVLSWMGVKYVLVHVDEYKKTGLVEGIDEIKNIHNNNSLKFIKSFEDVEVYEVVAKAVEPQIE